MLKVRSAFLLYTDYHAKICPDCIKMRRAVDKYLGHPEGTSSKPDSVLAYRNLNLPNSRPGSRMSLHGPDGPDEYQRETPIPISRQDFEDRRLVAYNNSGSYDGERSGNTGYGSNYGSSHYTGHSHDSKHSSNLYAGHHHGSNTCCENEDAVHTHIRIPEPVTTRTVQEQFVKHYDEVYSKPEWTNNTKLVKPEPRDWKTSSSLVEYKPSAGNFQEPDYFRRDTAYDRSSGKFPVDNMQFETTFKKEVCESVTRY